MAGRVPKETTPKLYAHMRVCPEGRRGPTLRRLLALAVSCVVAIAGCGGGGGDSSGSPTLAESIDTESPSGTEVPASSGDWHDAPGNVQVYNYLVDGGEEVAVDLYWFVEELVDDYKPVQHTERFATLEYGEHTDVMASRYFGSAGAEPDELLYLAVPSGTPVAEEAASESVLGEASPLLEMDLYHFHSDAATTYLNDGGTVVVFLSPETHGSTEARPRVQSFYADLYPSGEVNFPPAENEVPQAGTGEVVLSKGFLFGTEARAESGRLEELMGWRLSADGTCLPEEGSKSYGGDGADWMWVVSETAEITIHPYFHTDRGISDCVHPAWQEPISLRGIERPFALIVPTASGEPTMEILEIP